VGSDSEMTPREQIASVPYAMIASTVANGAISADKLDPGLFTVKMTQSAQVPSSKVLGTRPWYYVDTVTIPFSEPFPHKTLYVVAWLGVEGDYIGIPMAQPWVWNREGFTFSTRFYYEGDASRGVDVRYTAVGY